MLLQNLKNASPSRKTTGGFTLVEMLVVIVMIGILAAIAVPIFLSQSDKASDAALKSDLSNAARMLSVAEASGVSLPATLTAGESADLGAAGTITPAFTLNVSGSGASLCVEGVSGSGDVYSADLANGLRNFDCAGNANGVAPLVLSYADATFTPGSNNETLAATTSGGTGTKTYSVAGSLPAGVTFDEATGEFTGPAGSAWNFTATQVTEGASPCALTTTGAVKCWGSNTQGQLGDGTTTNSNTPVTVLGISGATQISGGLSHTCAVVDGGVKCWGHNGNGRLGNGTSTDSSTPVDVSGLTSGVASVSAGGDHSCAITTSGGAKCWGVGFSGELGNGSYGSSSTPVDVTGLSSGVTAIAAGDSHTCAVVNGGAKCWGNNFRGSLGDNNIAFYSCSNPFATDEAMCTLFEGIWYPVFNMSATPVDVVGLSSGVADIAAGNHSCAITTAGAAKCWGSNFYGQIGDGTTEFLRATPATVSGLTSGVSYISAGPTHACAVVNGAAKCWGDNSWRQLGDGTATQRNAPVDVTGLASGVTHIGTSGLNTCAVTGGLAQCWGNNGNGQLGDGTTTTSSTPVTVSGQGPQPGFPATVDVTVTDSSGSTTESVTLSVG